MKTWQSLAISVVLIALALIVISILPGNAAVFVTLKTVVLWIPMAIWSSFVVLVLFGGPFAIGALYRVYLVPWIDNLIEERQEMGGWSIFFLGLAVSIFVGALWIGVTMLSSYNGWVAGIFKAVGWKGFWEVAPIGWGLFGFLASLSGLGIACASSSDY